MVAANKGTRKAFAESLEAFSRFRKRHDNARMYIHAMRNTPDGLNLDRLISQLDIPKDSIRFVNQVDYAAGLSEQHMAEVYNISDVLLNPAYGEGFGLPIAEAQACGTPVITQNCTSMSELTYNGIAIEPGQKVYLGLTGHWQFTPVIDRIEAALEDIYGWGDDHRKEQAEIGATAIRARFSWPVVRENYWKPLLEKVESGLDLNG